MAWLKDSRLSCEFASKIRRFRHGERRSTRLFAVDPLVDGGRPEAPELAYLNACNLPSKHHALKRAGMDAEQGCCGVTIQ
jgi:hypothetical protein